MEKQTMFKLPPIISDGMVIQQNKPICFWGFDVPNQHMYISLENETVETMAGEDGSWKVYFSERTAGGPYTANIRGSEERSLSDIYIGEVWLAGGQSNMEMLLDRAHDLYETEIETMQLPLVREFRVPIEFDFSGPQELSKLSGKWRTATPDNTLEMSALGTFFAENLHRKLNVPVGILMTAVGGTPIEAWMTADDLTDYPEATDKLEKLQTAGWIEDVTKRDEKRVQKWYKKVEKLEKTQDPYDHWTEPAFDDSGWEEITVPGMLKGTSVGSEAGAIWFRQNFQVEDLNLFEQKARLNLGALIDYDEVWLNGVPIGKTEYRYPPRKYPVPKGVIQLGENVLAVRLLINGDNGGFVGGPGKEYLLEGDGEPINLAGVWKAKRVAKVDALAQITFIQYGPTGVHNSMLYPLKDYPIAGFLFYQGESNTGAPEVYADLMKRMVGRWRLHWNDHTLPFLYVQLTNYSDPLAQEDDRMWGALRLQQAEVERTVPRTNMTVSIDIGEANDLHPHNKKTLANRMAADALHETYRQEEKITKPHLQDVVQKHDNVVLTFDTEIQQMNANTYMEVLTADGDWQEVSVKTDKTTVLLSLPNTTSIRGVRYAYLNNPENPALFSKDGYPVGPFLWEK